MATMRLGKPNARTALPMDGDADAPRLEDPESQRIREIQALADLLEKQLITREEFDRAKGRLLG
jgi:hypothetical protein